MNENEARVTFKVPECNMGELEARIAKLAKRAAKLCLVPPQIVVEGYKDIPLVVRIDSYLASDKPSLCETPDLTKVKIIGYRRFINVRLQGEAPTIPGWKLVAVIEHGDTEVGNVLRVAPGMNCPASYRKATGLCQHCGFTRRRLETFVLVDAAGIHKQVGRNCLADFCRDAEAASLLCSASEILSSALGLCGCAESEGFCTTGGHIERVPTDSVLAMTSRIIRHAGWLSRTKARENPYGPGATADIVTAIFFDRKFFEAKSTDSNELRALRDAAKDVTDDDVATATAALEWIRAKRSEAEQLTDYFYNLLVVATEETVQRKHFGILCSLVATYQREQERLAGIEREKKVRAISEHFGEAGKRGRWTATYIGGRAFDGNSYGYGSEPTVRWMHRFSVGGNIAVWWTGTELSLELNEEVIIVGSVKKHEDYKGTKQTVLSRCDVNSKMYQGKCPACGGVIITADRGKNCPHCKKRGLKMSDACFPCLPEELKVGQHTVETL